MTSIAPRAFPERRDDSTQTLLDARKQLTRDRILEAAREVFLREGFSAASVEAIAARAGLSRQTFYQYFRNKHDVLAGLLALSSSVTAAALEGLAELDEPSLADLRGFIEFQIDRYSANKSTYAILGQAEMVDPTVRQLTQRRRDHYVDVLASAIRRSRRRSGAPVRRAESHVEAMLLTSQIERFCNLWFVQGWDVDRNTAVRVLARTWHATFTG